LIAFAAGGLLVETALLTDTSIEISHIVAVVLVVFGAYRLAPYVLNDAGYLGASFNRSKAILAAVLLSAAICTTAVFLEPVLFFVLLVCGFLYWLYQIGRPVTTGPLRNQGWLKPLIISLAWTSCVIASLIDAARFSLISQDGVVVWGSVMLFVLAMALLCDVADVDADRQTGVLTLPVRYKQRSVLYVSMIIGVVPVLLIFHDHCAGHGWVISLCSTTFCILSAVLGVLLLPAAKSRLMVDVFMFMKPLPLILVSI
jgi:4-hydroxybenzoate polyprenyltransferase